MCYIHVLYHIHVTSKPEIRIVIVRRKIMNNKITHSVILTVDPSSIFGTFLEHMSSQIKISEDKAVLYIWCSEVDASHPVYLEIVAHKIPTPQDIDNLGVGMKTRIPHSLVLMIDDSHSVEKRFLGFHHES